MMAMPVTLTTYMGRLKMSKLDKALQALKAVVNGMPEEIIDTHIRNLLDFCERTIKEIEDE